MPGILTSNTVGRPPVPPSDDGFGDDGRRPDWGGSRRASFTALLVLLASTTMVFAALTSAYFLRRGISGDWRATPLPPMLWLNTAVLLLSSGLLEVARRHLRTGRRTSFNAWWTAATAAGGLFFIGQALVWREMHTAGYYLSANPSSAFFYLLTAVHGVHLLGAMGGLVYIDVRALRFELGPARRTGADVSAVFWHFLDGIWICLLLLFSWWA